MIEYIQKNIKYIIGLFAITCNFFIHYHLYNTVDDLKHTISTQAATHEHVLDSLNNIIKQNNNILKRDSILRQSIKNNYNISIPQKFTYKEIVHTLKESKKYNIPPHISFNLIKAESSFNKNSLSSAGARGYMQIMPGTYRGYSKKLKITKHDHYANISVGLFYLKTVYDCFGKYKHDDDLRWRLTLLSYNYGPGRVKNNLNNFMKNGKLYNYKYINNILLTSK